MMKPYLNRQQFIQSEDGATALEYALMTSLIAAATVGAQTTMRGDGCKYVYGRHRHDHVGHELVWL